MDGRSSMEVTMNNLRRALLTTLLAGLFAAPVPAGAQSGASSPSALDARLRALEARVAVLEGRSGAAGTPAAAAGPACRKLNVNGSQIVPGATLTVTVNGTTVATFDENAYGDLEPFMRPGPNTVGLAFATPGKAGTEAELRCLPPGVESSRTTILRLRPTPRRLSAQAQVMLAPQ
jgi:hypothetical protein